MQIKSDFYRIQYNYNKCSFNDRNSVQKYKNSAFPKKTILQQDNFSRQNNYYEAVGTISFTAKHISKMVRGFKEKIGVVFSDIDGTISPKSNYISPNSKNAISLLNRKHLPFVLVTGRCYEDTLPIVEQFSQHPDYIISSLGACITDKNGSELKKVVIDKQEGKNFVEWYKNELAKNKNLNLIMYFDDYPYSDRKIQYPWKTGKVIENLYNFDCIFDSDLPLNKIVIYDTNRTISDIDKSIDRLGNYGVENLQLQKVDNKIYEFYEKSISKSNAIKDVLAFLKLTPNKAIAIGDSPNDLDMLDYIRSNNGLAIAMGGSSDEVIASSNAITDSVLNDGFANCIEYIFSK